MKPRSRSAVHSNGTATSSGSTDAWMASSVPTGPGWGIEAGFNIHELQRKLSSGPLDHPYPLQLLTYGYFFWLEHQVVPDLTFHLVSTRTRESIDLALKLDLPAYEKWLDPRLQELVKEAKKAEKRALRRRKLASALSFLTKPLVTASTSSCRQSSGG